MKIETGQPKYICCDLPPDRAEIVITDLERIVQILGKVGVGSQAYYDYHQEALENKKMLVEEGLDVDYIDSLMPPMPLNIVTVAA